MFIDGACPAPTGREWPSAAPRRLHLLLCRPQPAPGPPGACSHGTTPGLAPAGRPLPLQPSRAQTPPLQTHRRPLRPLPPCRRSPQPRMRTTTASSAATTLRPSSSTWPPPTCAASAAWRRPRWRRPRGPRRTSSCRRAWAAAGQATLDAMARGCTRRGPRWPAGPLARWPAGPLARWPAGSLARRRHLLAARRAQGLLPRYGCSLGRRARRPSPRAFNASVAGPLPRATRSGRGPSARMGGAADPFAALPLPLTAACIGPPPRAPPSDC
jgi:hypothetical protein